MHLQHYTRPDLQKFIIRILWMVSEPHESASTNRIFLNLTQCLNHTVHFDSPSFINISDLFQLAGADLCDQLVACFKLAGE